MAIHRTATLPVPSDEIARIRSTLSRQYGSTVWEAGDRRVLLVRVPREEPDPVNDVELCIEFLEPTDAKDIQHCLLLGDASTAQVYAEPIQQMMAQRIEFDRRQCQEWRERLPGKLSHSLYQSPEDPRRRWRLAVRLPTASVKDLEEDHLDAVADGLGPQLESQRFQELAAVYLIAGEDHVRLQPDRFVDQLLEAWKDEERRRRLELELAAKKEAERRRREAERSTLLRELDKRFRERERVARAPVRSTTSPAGHITSAEAPRTASSDAAAVPGQGELAPLDEDEATLTAGPAKAREVRDRVDDLARKVESAEARTGVDRARRRLEEAGFDVLVDPETPGHTIDLAAERPEGDPQRVVVRVAERLDTECARELLKTARELDVDSVLCVTPKVEPEGARLLVATKVRTVHPDALDEHRF